MKILAFVLLLTATVQAQSIADAARKERERQAAHKNVPVYSNETIHIQAPPEEAAPAEANPAPAGGAAAPANATANPAAPAAAAAETTNDVQKWNDDLAKLRAHIRELQDQVMTDQLAVNDWTNKFYAPVTDTEARASAQTQMIQAQKNLSDAQKELQNAQDELKKMETEGPPKKP